MSIELVNAMTALTVATNQLTVIIQQLGTGVQNTTPETMTGAEVMSAIHPAPTEAGAAVTAQRTAAMNGSLVTDVNGLPWDARIHSSAVDGNGAHKLTGKNVWQKKRGVSKEEIAAVEAELMNTVAGGAGIGSQVGDLAGSDAFAAQDTTSLFTPPQVAGFTPPQVQQPVVLVLPVPANPAMVTQQDVINVVQVYTQKHGADNVAGHMSQWGMTDISQLPQNYYGQWVTYLAEQDVVLSNT